MKKSRLKLITLLSVLMIMGGTTVYAKTDSYRVQKGDTLWLISKKYKIGISEILSANTQFENPNLIYPNDLVYIPLADENVTNTQEEILKLVNKERSAAGLNPLELDWQVSRVASYKSQDMADKNYFSHESPTYGSPFEMLENFNIKYRSAGENIAKGQKSPSSVMNAWMNSTGHRANILNSNYTHLGVGYVEDNGTTYWTQMFVTY